MPWKIFSSVTLGGSVGNGLLNQLVLLEKKCVERFPPCIAILPGCVSDLENTNCAFSDVCVDLIDRW